jgi:hypothetical protein
MRRPPVDDSRRGTGVDEESDVFASLDAGRDRVQASPRQRAKTAPESVGGSWQALGRTLRLALLLLLLIAAALVSTTFLDRPTQVLLKAFLIVFLSVLPGWLYLQFIAIKGTGLYDEYVLNLYRLKIDDVANLPKPPPG